MRADTQTALRMSAEELKADNIRDYNPREWDKTVERYMKYGDVQFFKIPRGKYDYYRFYAVYTLGNGMKVMNTVSYGASLTSGGFAEVFIFEFDKDFNFYDNGRVEISTRKVTFRDEDGTEREGMVAHNDKGIEYMTRMSVNLGAIWTKTMI